MYCASFMGSSLMAVRILVVLNNPGHAHEHNHDCVGGVGYELAGGWSLFGCVDGDVDYI